MRVDYSGRGELADRQQALNQVGDFFRWRFVIYVHFQRLFHTQGFNKIIQSQAGAEQVKPLNPFPKIAFFVAYIYSISFISDFLSSLFLFLFLSLTLTLALLVNNLQSDAITLAKAFGGVEPRCVPHQSNDGRSRGWSNFCAGPQKGDGVLEISYLNAIICLKKKLLVILRGRGVRRLEGGRWKRLRGED